MKRVVLDTCILVAAFRSRHGASNLLLQWVATEVFRPLVSTALFLEYEDVLLRPEHRLVSGMSEADIRRALAAFASAAEPVEVHFRWRPRLRDPADEMVIETAINGRADALVTHNIRDFERVAKQFGLALLTPQQFVKEYRK